MTRISFKLVKLKQYKYCPSCRRFKHWRQFKRTQPGGILPMLVYAECNLCARIRAWHSNLSDAKKRQLEMMFTEQDPTDELGVCEICGTHRYGEVRPQMNDKWICNYCFWMHVFGRKMLDKEDLE